MSFRRAYLINAVHSACLSGVRSEQRALQLRFIASCSRVLDVDCLPLTTMSVSIKVVRAVESSVANLQLGNLTRHVKQELSHTPKPALISESVRAQIDECKLIVESLASCPLRTDYEEKSSARDKTLSVHIPRPMFQAEGPPIEQGILGERWRIESTLDAINLLLKLCKLYGFRDASYSPQRSYDLWHNQSLRCGLVKFLKYKMAAFFSHYADQELPPLPTGMSRDFPQHLLCGSAGRFITYLMRGDKDRARGFALAVLYLKKGLPRPSSAHVRKGVEDTFDILTNEHHPEPCTIPNFNGSALSIEFLSDEVRRTVHEVFSGTVYVDDPSPFAPSTKANYTENRSEYGTLGTLLDRKYLREGSPDYFEDLFAFEQAVLDSSGVPCLSTQTVSVNSELAPRIKCLFREVYSLCRSAARTEKVDTSLVGLSEALKVRVISKGPPLTYFVLKPLQKFMHSIMRKHPTFALIGQPATAEFVQKTFSNHSGDYLSADYSAATDMLNPALSRAAVDAICDCCQVPCDLRTRFHLALTGHCIQLGRETKLPQLWGQLMGSIVSFPILCLVNATICRVAYMLSSHKPYSLHESLNKFRLARIPLCVNGDDALLRCNSDTFFIWKSVACLAGLSPSVGKVYYHARYSNINSMSFHEGRLIPYVNFGLMMGMTRSSIPMDDDSRTVVEKDHEFLSNVGSRHTELIESCPPDIQVEVHLMFIRIHNEILTKYTIPWYIPKSRGGLGLRPLFVYVNGIETCEYLSLNESGKRFGPSRSDLVCCQLQLNVASPIPCFTNIIEHSARRAWSNSLPKLFRAWALPDDLFYQACSLSQSERFQSLDLAAYYLCPSSVLGAVDDYEFIAKAEIRSLEKYWRRLYALRDRKSVV